MTQDAHQPRRIFVAGTWNSKKAGEYKAVANAIGIGLAKRGFDLTTGPGTGISGEVIAGYKSISNRGTLRVYLPSAESMQLVGEEVVGEFDETVHTDFDYPMRNVFHIKQSDALVVITGGDGTLEECLPALIDYSLPTIVVEDSGAAARALAWLSENLFPEWKQNLYFVRSAEDVLRILSDSSMQGDGRRSDLALTCRKYHEVCA